MKKLRLELAELEISSFVPETTEGGVNSMEATTLCNNTAEVGCYPSKYCSGAGCVQTYWDTCMTNNYSQC